MNIRFPRSERGLKLRCCQIADLRQAPVALTYPSWFAGTPHLQTHRSIVGHRRAADRPGSRFGAHRHAMRIQPDSNTRPVAVDLLGNLKDQGEWHATKQHSGRYAILHAMGQVGVIADGVALNMIADTFRQAREARLISAPPSVLGHGRPDDWETCDEAVLVPNADWNRRSVPVY